MGFLLWATSARAETLTIDATKTGLTETTYLTSAKTFGLGEVTFGINHFNPSTGQMKVNNTGNSAFTFYNTTAIEGIQEVRITHDVKSIGTIYMKVESAVITGSTSTSDIKGSTSNSSPYVTTFKVPAGTEASYFKIQLTSKGSNVVKASKFEIDYGSKEKTATPVINGETSFTDKTTVSITAEEGAKIWYYADKDGFFTPQLADANLYSAPFEITDHTYVVAIAQVEGKERSGEVRAEFVKVANGSWKLVETAADLEIGARYLIGYNGRAVSNAAVVKNKLQGTAATVKDGFMTPTDDMMVFTLGQGVTSGTYSLASNNYNGKTDAYYLTIPSSTATDATMSTTPADVYITYASGSADVKIQKASSDSRIFMGNSVADAVFGYYAISNTSYPKVQLYKEEDNREACAAPAVTITPSAVIEGESATVKIDGIEAGASVRYTTDGSLPSDSKGETYNGEFTLSNISSNTTVKAIAYAEGKKNSAVAEATVTVTLKPRMPKVTWSVDGTTYTAENDGAYEVSAGTTLTITAVNGDKVKVTNLETEQSRTLDSPQTLTVNKDIMASFASVSGDMTSDELTAIFTIKKVMPETPVITWTKDGQAMTGVNDGEYDVYAGTQITVSSKNATKIVVADSENFDGEYDAPFTFTLYNDDMFTFTGKNADGTSSGVTVAYTIVERPKEMTYALVTDASQLKAGNKYVIAYKDDDDCVAVSNDGNWSVAKNQYRPVVRDGFTIDANNVLHDRSLGTADGTVGVMVFELGGSAGAWTLTADNYIKPADGVQNADEPAPGNQVKLHEFSKGYNFSMTTENSPLKITFEGNQAKITTTEMESAGYVVKFNSNSSWIGLSKTTNDYPMVQLYGYEPLAKPEAVVVTYTKVKDGEALVTEDCGEYTAINESKITVSSKNATQIDVNGTKHDAVNGVYSFTSDVDEIFIVKGVNDAGETAEYTIEMLVDYEADNVMDMQTLSRKQKDRADKNVWAPVKFVGSAFIRGHYMIDEGLSEVLWIEDANGDAAAIYEFGDEFATPGHSIESNMMLKNFKVRSEDYYNATDRRIMQLISWPEDVETEVGTYDFAAWLQGQEYGTEASASNEFRLQKFQGDITFTADGGTLTVGEKSIAVTNALSFKAAGDKQSFGRTAEGSFNWLPGREWLTGQTKTNAHVIGFVMPEGNGSNLKYVVYPAQITDNAGNITDVDGVENDGDGVYVQGGVIYAPAGSRVFGLNGAQVKTVQALNGGVYVVVTPDGRAVKVLVK